jgi:hypothetical protein
MGFILDVLLDSNGLSWGWFCLIDNLSGRFRGEWMLS